MPRARLILNPHAGRGRLVTAGKTVVERLAANGWEAEIRATSRGGHATQLAAEAAASGVDVVVALGGDGTVHEVATGLLGTGSALAVLPAGSGNDFAVGIGCGDRESGLQAVIGGTDTDFDAWSIDGQPFFNSLGLLASGLVSGRAARMWRPLVRWRYLLASLTTLLSYRGQDSCWTLTGDDGETTLAGRWLLAEICNGPLTGGGFRFAPDAAFDDGRVDACLIEPIGLLTGLRLLPRAAKGERLDHPSVSVQQASTVVFSCAEPVAYHRDGEPGWLAAGDHEIKLLAERLRVRMPAGSPT